MELMQLLYRHVVSEIVGKKTLTGWSASRSEPYIRTRLADLSRSEIFLANHGSSDIARIKEQQVKLHHIEAMLKHV